MPIRTVFFISDRTGITAEALGNSLLTQFDGIQFNRIHLAFVDTLEKAQDAVKQIKEASLKDGQDALVFSTQINQEFRDLIERNSDIFFDFFETFIHKMENSLSVKSCHTAGRSHSIDNNNNYSNRINGINFALNGDDGINPKSYADADIIIIGVSRSGKTPTCIFMALQYGIKASNYPLIEQDLDTTNLPKDLQPYKHKLFGLTINPIRLQKIRDKRRGNSAYSSLQKCKSEVKCAEDIYYSNNIPYIDTTQMSIEEITAKITTKLALR